MSWFEPRLGKAFWVLSWFESKFWKLLSRESVWIKFHKSILSRELIWIESCIAIVSHELSRIKTIRDWAESNKKESSATQGWKEPTRGGGGSMWLGQCWIIESAELLKWWTGMRGRENYDAQHGFTNSGSKQNAPGQSSRWDSQRRSNPSSRKNGLAPAPKSRNQEKLAQFQRGTCVRRVYLASSPTPVPAKYAGGSGSGPGKRFIRAPAASVPAPHPRCREIRMALKWVKQGCRPLKRSPNGRRDLCSANGY